MRAAVREVANRKPEQGGNIPREGHRTRPELAGVGEAALGFLEEIRAQIDLPPQLSVSRGARQPQSQQRSDQALPRRSRLGKDAKAVGSDMVSYSGRNTKDFPLKFQQKGKELLVCDDDEDEANHEFKVFGLYLDGNIMAHDVEEFGGAANFKVGADSPFEHFKVVNNQ